MIDIQTTRPGGGLQTTTSGSSFPGLPGAAGGGLGSNMDFFRNLAMRGIALKEQAAKQRMALEAQQAAREAEDHARAASEHQQALTAQQRDAVYAGNRNFQFTHSRPDLESGMAMPADYSQNSGVGLRSPITSPYGPGGGIEDFADEMDRKRRQQQAASDSIPHGTNLFG